MDSTVSGLKSRYDTSEHVWFFVRSNFRILDFNQKAARNSVTLHNKELAVGDSILDYARDTSNKIDSEFITCFGKAAAGQIIETEQQIGYKDKLILFKST